MEKLQNLIKSQQLNVDIISHLFKEADLIRKYPKQFQDCLSGKTLVTLFYEPSTRTRLSFESAMVKLGGHVLSTENAREFSSAIKGESIEDTIRVLQCYSDCVVIRHHEEGTSEKISEIVDIPIINAGDGMGQHPTQALLDLYTIYREIGTITGFTISLVGDLYSGRTVRSLCYLLGKVTNNVTVNLVSPSNLKMKDDILHYMDRHGVKYQECDMEYALSNSDVIYMTRIQKERISEEDYLKAKGKFVINEDNLSMINKDSRILHPLPHVEEISLSLNTEQNDKRVAYFRQVENGLYLRMAILKYLLL